MEYVIKKDGEVVKYHGRPAIFKTENEACIALLKIQPQSIDYACKYEGYKIEKIK